MISIWQLLSKMIRNIRNRWRRSFLSLEFILALILTGAIVLWNALSCSSSDIIYKDWSDIYPTTTTAAVALLGFSLTVTSIVLGFSTSESLRILRNSVHYPVLWDTLFSTIRFLGFLSLWSLISLIVDRPASPILWLRIILLFLIIGSVLRLARSIWIIQKVVRIVASPS